jgi:hypothetical protein
LQATSSSSSSASSETNIPVKYGIDWSDRARPTSHIWFPYKLNDPSAAQPCALCPCKDSKSNQVSDFVQCVSCLNVVHTQHLVDMPTTNSIRPCRLTFSESINSNAKDNQTNFDRHYWLYASILTKPCAFCKRKSMSGSLFGSGRPSTMPSLDAMTKGANPKSPPPSSTSPKMSEISSGFQCLWCSRGYHRRCWDRIYDQGEKNKCDYGVLR